jgi:hypothetical protein
MAEGGNSTRRIAGTYLIDVNLDGFMVQALATLTKEGLVIATDTDDHALFHSPKHGVWRRTGRREVTIRIYEYDYDATGVLERTFRLDFFVHLDRDLEGGEGDVVFDVFLPFQDLLNDEPFPAGTGTFTFRQILLDD